MIDDAVKTKDWPLLRSRAQAVYVVVVMQWNRGNKWATQELIGRITGLSKTSVMRSIGELRSRGYVREYRSSHGVKVRMPVVPVDDRKG